MREGTLMLVSDEEIYQASKEEEGMWPDQLCHVYWIQGAKWMRSLYEDKMSEMARKAWEAAREHPNWCDPVSIEPYTNEHSGNSAGVYWRAKKINYEYEDFDEWKAKKLEEMKK